MKKDFFSEDELKRAAQSVVKSMLSSLPNAEESDHEFSPEFRAKMDCLVRKERRRESFAKIGHKVASIALAALIGASTWLSVDVEARAAFFTWVREVYEDSFVYRFFGTPSAEALPDYEITALPDGYEEIISDNDGEIATKVYHCDETDMVLTYYKLQSGWAQALFQDAPQNGCTSKEMLVNGMPANLCLYEDASYANELLWIDETANIVFHITAFCEENALLEIAESVQIKK